MKVHLLKPILHDRLGRLPKGSVVDLVDIQAKDFVESGIAEYYQTKVLNDRPLMTVGSTTQQSASPAVPASPKQTSKPSKAGKKTATKKPPLSRTPASN